MNHRTLRLQKTIRDELGVIIEREIECEGALMTITEVSLDSRLACATVYVSVYPKEKTDQAIQAIVSQKEHLRRLLMKKVLMRQFPDIVFQADHGNEHAAKVEKLLQEAENKKEAK